MTTYKVYGKIQHCFHTLTKMLHITGEKIIVNIFIVLYSHNSPASRLNKRLLIEQGLRGSEISQNDVFQVPLVEPGILQCWWKSWLQRSMSEKWPWFGIKNFGAWYGVTKSQTRLSGFTFCTLSFICWLTMNNAS